MFKGELFSVFRVSKKLNISYKFEWTTKFFSVTSSKFKQIISNWEVSPLFSASKTNQGTSRHFRWSVFQQVRIAPKFPSKRKWLPPRTTGTKHCILVFSGYPIPTFPHAVLGLKYLVHYLVVLRICVNAN